MEWYKELKENTVREVDKKKLTSKVQKRNGIQNQHRNEGYLGTYKRKKKKRHCYNLVQVMSRGGLTKAVNGNG